MLTIVGALYFTYTRSAYISILLGFISILLLIKTRIKGEILMAAAILISGFMLLSPLVGQYVEGRSESMQEGSTIARQILWQASVNIALDHPVLGIGSDNFISLSREYESTVDNSLIAYERQNYWSFRTLGNDAPHNDFLNIWVSYGTLALIVYIWIFFAVMRNFLDSYRLTRSKFIKGLAVGFAAALIAYGINAFYHNLIATMSLFWILAGFSLAISKIAFSKSARG